jgi:transcription antitermination factor NusG
MLMVEWGEVLPAFQPAAIYRPGRSRWHALLVFPQRERAAKAWLGKWGCDAFFPVRRKYRWRRNQRVPYEAAYLPGYLFANFPGEPRWHAILGDDRRLIRDVLRMSDGVTPGELHPDTLVRLEAMRSVEAQIENVAAARKVLRKGDVARFNSGPMADMPHEVVVVSIDGGKAKFEIRITGGSPVRGEARLAMLDKLEPQA